MGKSRPVAHPRLAPAGFHLPLPVRVTVVAVHGGDAAPSLPHGPILYPASLPVLMRVAASL
jgi:hypothetical protein